MAFQPFRRTMSLPNRGLDRTGQVSRRGIRAAGRVAGGARFAGVVGTVPALPFVAFLPFVTQQVEAGEIGHRRVHRRHRHRQPEGGFRRIQPAPLEGPSVEGQMQLSQRGGSLPTEVGLVIFVPFVGEW